MPTQKLVLYSLIAVAGVWIVYLISDAVKEAVDAGADSAESIGQTATSLSPAGEVSSMLTSIKNFF